MQAGGIAIMSQGTVARSEVPWFARLLGKFVLDVLPGALASLIGTLLLTHYQLAQLAHQAPPPAAEQATQASAETMARLRDEHALIMDFLKSRIAAERNRDMAEDADAAQAAADAKTAAEIKLAPAMMETAAKTAPPRPKPHAAPPAVAHAPLVIAQAQPDHSTGVSSGGRLADDPDSLFAKTLDIKDHVVAATRHVVSMIGDMFASVGGRLSEVMPGARQYSSAS